MKYEFFFQKLKNLCRHCENMWKRPQISENIHHKQKINNFLIVYKIFKRGKLFNMLCKWTSSNNKCLAEIYQKNNSIYRIFFILIFLLILRQTKTVHISQWCKHSQRNRKSMQTSLLTSENILQTFIPRANTKN